MRIATEALSNRQLLHLYPMQLFLLNIGIINAFLLLWLFPGAHRPPHLHINLSMTQRQHSTLNRHLRIPTIMPPNPPPNQETETRPLRAKAPLLPPKNKTALSQSSSSGMQSYAERDERARGELVFSTKPSKLKGEFTVLWMCIACYWFLWDWEGCLRVIGVEIEVCFLLSVVDTLPTFQEVGTGDFFRFLSKTYVDANA